MARASKRLPGQARQGDILYERVDSVPEGAVKVAGRAIARGTATGHSHALRAGDKAHLMRAPDGVLYVVAEETTLVVHEDHKPPIALSTGIWRVTRQREYEPAGSRVVDD
jgi:hypothetical protein